MTHKTIVSLLLLALGLTACTHVPESTDDNDDPGTDAGTRHRIPNLSVGALAASDDDNQGIREVYDVDITPNSELRAQYFQTALTDTLKTPDGTGAFQFYSGAWGQGAIYTHAYPIPGSSEFGRSENAIYGAILQAWAQDGYETVLGYPVSPERDASDYLPESSCLSEGAVREQVFGFLRWDTGASRGGSRAVLCWSPDRGVWILPKEIAQGLAGELQLTTTVY